MNKKTIIAIVIIILIIALAIIVGVNLSKNDSKTTTTEPTATPTIKPTDAEETASPIPTETPSPEETATPEANTDISGMTEEQKREYAKSIAKSTWEKLGVQKQVFYSYDGAESGEVYLIAVREESTTNTLVTYKINIKTGSCEITY